MTHTPTLDPERVKTPQQISALLSQPVSPSAITTISDDKLAGLPELTDDEDAKVVAAARRMARIEKGNRLAREDYYERLNSEVYRPGAEELYYWMYQETKTPDSPRYVGPEGYQITEWNHHIFWALCLYFTADPRFETLHEQYQQFEDRRFRLDRGIALVGPVGCGKSKLMQIFANNPLEPYVFVDAKAVQATYENTERGMGGTPALTEFVSRSSGTPSLWRMNSGGWCFDDLGTEDIPAYHFNKPKNVMLHVLTERYTYRHQSGRTHLTMNLGGKQIESIYDLRVRDRLRETCNMIRFSSEAPSWRGRTEAHPAVVVTQAP